MERDMTNVQEGLHGNQSEEKSLRGDDLHLRREDDSDESFSRNPLSAVMRSVSASALSSVFTPKYQFDAEYTPTKLVVLNRTSSTSKIVYEVNDGTAAEGAMIASSKPFSSVVDSSSSPATVNENHHIEKSPMAGALLYSTGSRQRRSYSLNNDNTTKKTITSKYTPNRFSAATPFVPSPERVVSSSTSDVLHKLQSVAVSDAQDISPLVIPPTEHSITEKSLRDAPMDNPQLDGGNVSLVQPEKTLEKAPPPVPEKKPKKDEKTSHMVAKFGILLSRSSGRDKVAALFQYFSLFWGHQIFFPVSQATDAPWRNLEESMSSGRKVMRLFKWIKEFERAQRAAMTRDIGPHQTAIRAGIARILGFLMHTFSFFYYFIDNVVWASQIGLINKPSVHVEDIAAQQKKLIGNILKNMQAPDQNVKSPTDAPIWTKYQALEAKRQAATKLLDESLKRESQWKDWKNYSSLGRLVLACFYTVTQLDSIRQERNRMDEKFSLQIESVRQISGLGLDYTVSFDDEVECTTTNETIPALSVEEVNLRAERRQRIEGLEEFELENRRELGMVVCNLGILLQRLKMGIFAKIPIWGAGVLGVVAALLGIHKNWPIEQTERKPIYIPQKRHHL